MEKSIKLTLAPMTFKVSGKSQKELIENAQLAFEKALKNGELPQIVSYSETFEDALTLETAFPGLIVETVKGAEKGIVTAVNRKKLNVTLTGGRDVSGYPGAFKVSSATFEEARSKRHPSWKEHGFWNEGNTGYLKDTKGTIHEVIMGKKSGQTYKVYIIGSKERFFKLTEEQLKEIKDDKEEIK